MRGVHSAAATLICLLLPALASADFYSIAQLDAKIQGRIPSLPEGYGPFVIDEKMRARVGFWIDVYAKYHSWETAIHDVKFPQLVYSAVNTKLHGKGAIEPEKRRVLRILEELAHRSPQLAEGRMKRDNLSPEERRLYELFEKQDLLGQLPAAASAKRIRGQAGLRDGLEDALFVSGRYLPRMEKVFERFSLPIEIAYLPFVESGFNKKAVSKVGASGIWQFMPYTGKLYLRVDEEVDERNDPMRAAEAAARLMQQNFAMLGHWPLAVTAYNHGAVGMARAMKETGSPALADIIEKYEGPTFGFASQNFYASFLAAMHVAKNSEAYLGMVPRARKLEFDEFVMPHYMDLHAFLEKLEINEAEFRELNPALTPDVYKGKKYMPVGYTVRVPIEVRGNFLLKYEAIPAEFKFQEQKMNEEPVELVSDRKIE